MSKNIEDLQSKLPEFYAKDKTRELQHTQLSGKVENLQVWANDMKGTLDKAVNAMKYMRGENENTTASNRQRNTQQRTRRSRVMWQCGSQNNWWFPYVYVFLHGIAHFEFNCSWLYECEINFIPISFVKSSPCHNPGANVETDGVRSQV